MRLIINGLIRFGKGGEKMSKKLFVFVLAITFLFSVSSLSFASQLRTMLDIQKSGVKSVSAKSLKTDHSPTYVVHKVVRPWQRT
jgi:hypothetical protein